MAALRRRPLIVTGVALLTLGSGLLNLYSVMGRSLLSGCLLCSESFPWNSPTFPVALPC